MKTSAGCVLGILTTAAAASSEQVPRLTRAEYVASLRATEASLRAGDLDAARGHGGFLRGARIGDRGIDVGADESLLAPILGGGAFDPAAQAERIAATVRALEQATAGAAAPDAALLARIAESQRPRTLPRGGSAGAMPPGVGVPDSALSRTGRAWRAIVEWLEEWLKRFWPRRVVAEEKGSVTGPVIALMVAVMAALLLAAVRTLRRTSRAPMAEAPATLESARDEDPLAREVSDWEKRAAELARAGRYREAIRASYHAVLALLFRSGRLHYEKGRTNWEYAERVPADAGWRRGFVELVRRFEQEWYGHDRSTAEAWTESSTHSRRLLESLSGGRE